MRRRDALAIVILAAACVGCNPNPAAPTPVVVFENPHPQPVVKDLLHSGGHACDPSLLDEPC